MLSCVSGQRIRLRLSRLKKEKFEPRYDRVEVPLLHRCDLRVLVAQSDKIPERRHFDELTIKLLVELPQEDLKVLRDMLDSTPVEEHKIKDFGSFVHVFLPLGLLAGKRGRLGHGRVEDALGLLLGGLLGLGAEVLQQVDEALVLDVGGLGFENAFDVFQVVVDLVGLLHVVLVRSLEDPLFGLLRMEEPQFDADVHRVLELFDSLLHRAEVGCEVGAGLLLDEGENDRQLVEEVVDGVEHWVQGQIGIRREEELVLHQHRDLDAELLLPAGRIRYHIIITHQFYNY